jgi:hypothetical protein
MDLDEMLKHLRCLCQGVLVVLVFNRPHEQ